MKVQKIRQEKKERKMKEIKMRKEKMKEKMIRIYTENGGEKTKEIVEDILLKKYKEECEELGGLTNENKNDLYELAEEAVQKEIPQCFGYSEVNYHSLIRAAVNEAIRDEIYLLLQIKNMEEVLKLAISASLYIKTQE